MNLNIFVLFLLGFCCADTEVLRNEELNIQQDDLNRAPDVESSKVIEKEQENHSEEIARNDNALPLETPAVIYEETGKKSNEIPVQESNESDQTDNAGYKTGSVCVYCKYCKLCKLCDKKCPCAKDSKLEHCNMCKYCDYCHLCDVVCQSVCVPGGFMDMFSSAVYDVLPTFSEKAKKDVEVDIEKARSFIKEYL